jgi:hypothetical protein
MHGRDLSGFITGETRTDSDWQAEGNTNLSRIFHFGQLPETACWPTGLKSNYSPAVLGEKGNLAQSFSASCLWPANFREARFWTVYELATTRPNMTNTVASNFRSSSFVELK